MGEPFENRPMPKVIFGLDAADDDLTTTSLSCPSQTASYESSFACCCRLGYKIFVVEDGVEITSCFAEACASVFACCCCATIGCETFASCDNTFACCTCTGLEPVTTRWSSAPTCFSVRGDESACCMRGTSAACFFESFSVFRGGEFASISEEPYVCRRCCEALSMTNLPADKLRCAGSFVGGDTEELPTGIIASGAEER
mmetsp:Transcript_38066/g.61649  ORF Transcript_38066/g.61649 Transcript_38066/m.61649 type:complete len:200 (-) Transcript_38066:938-1537(-)